MNGLCLSLAAVQSFDAEKPQCVEIVHRRAETLASFGFVPPCSVHNSERIFNALV